MMAFDSLTNFVAGLGNMKDKRTAGAFVLQFLDQGTIDALYASDWIAARVVDSQPRDETRVWREWQAGKRQILAIESLEASLGVRAKVRKARTLARKDGGSAILLGFGDSDPTTEIRPENIRKGGLRYLNVFDRTEITPTELERDPYSPYCGLPKGYHLHGTGVGAEVVVHPSRIVRFLGDDSLSRSSSVQGWGFSVLQRIYDDLLSSATTRSASASLVLEAKIDVFKVKDLSLNARDPNWRDRMLARFGLANLAKSLNNALILDSEEEWDQKQIKFEGLPDYVKLFLEICAGAAGMPVSRLLGKAPTGLNSSVGGDAETRAWYDKVSEEQNTELRPTLHPLDEALIRSALGTRPAEVYYQWAPLWQQTEGEKADTALKLAQVTEIYASGSFFKPTVLRKVVENQLIEAGTYPGLDAALQAEGNSGEKPAPLIVKATATPPKPKTDPGKGT